MLNPGLDPGEASVWNAINKAECVRYIQILLFDQNDIAADYRPNLEPNLYSKSQAFCLWIGEKVGAE